VREEAEQLCGEWLGSEITEIETGEGGTHGGCGERKLDKVLRICLIILDSKNHDRISGETEGRKARS
jgi:hypothetical protein